MNAFISNGPAVDIDANYNLFDRDGVLRIMPLSFWRQFDQESISVFCMKRGLYCLPTEELVFMLQALIGHRRAIEIGAGNGAIGKALGIPCTDSFQQRQPEYAAHYQAMSQPIVEYGRHVEALSASEALRRYKPEVVVGAWITHRYDASRHAHGGNEVGVDEHEIIHSADEYLMVGNLAVHQQKLVLCDISSGKLPWHKASFVPAPVASRSMRGAGQDFLVAIQRRTREA